MENNELRKRIETASKRLNSFPDWVRNNNVFQGGVPSELRPQAQNAQNPNDHGNVSRNHESEID
jgi:hypothetical protein